MHDSISPIHKAILYFIISKILMTVVFFVIMPILFDRSIFMYDDFGYYVSGDFGTGRNIGYRWLIWLLRIKTLDTTLPILLAFVINLSVDIAWIYLLRKHLSQKGIYLFALMLGAQPYIAVYTIKFSTILFAKIGLFIFCRELFHGSFNKIKKNTLSLWEVLLWTSLTLVRNSNLFIAAPYMFLKLRNKPWLAITISISFTCIILYSTWYDGLLVGVNPSSWPWSLSYVKTLLSIENNFISLIITFILRVLLLFGAREKLFNLGIEPFLVWGVPGLELCVYFLLGFIQLFGFCIGIRYIFQRFGIASLVMLISIGFAILTVSHQRYLIPFIPICLFGLALLLNSKKNK